MKLFDAVGTGLVTVSDLLGRLDDYVAGLSIPKDETMRRLHCLVSPTTKGGRAVIRIRKGRDNSWKLYPWSVVRIVRSFIEGMSDSPAAFLEGSHLCGMGHRGCANIDHVNFEDHATNLSRADCHRYSKCRACGFVQPIRVCRGHGDHPRCIQVEYHTVEALGASS